MGPSGAGKSSLLNVLAGRSCSAAGIQIDGRICVGGQEIDPVAYRRNIAYVMQDDALMATATPREALHFSAHLRLPSSTTPEEIDGVVEKLLDDLGLSSCADVMIGGALIKGISGGQRKRTSVGVELITDPSLLFLDEPTSGLDSYSAYSLVCLLKQMAAANCTVLCTIHQPSSEVFFLFDTVIYLKDGQVFYQGPPGDILPFYAARGHACPDDYNPSDFVMNLCQSESAEILVKQGLFMETPEAFRRDLQPASTRKSVGSTHVDFHAEASLTKQIFAIAYREVVNAYRDTPALLARYGITLLMSFLYGLIFLNTCGKDNADQDNFKTHVGAISMSVIFGLFASGQAVMLAFPFERPMILREYATGTYSIVAYFLSKLLVEAPMTFVQFIIQYLLDYYMMDMQGSFILMVLATWGLGMVSNSIAMGLGCMVPDVKDVTELAPLMYVPQILFAGFFIRTSQIPVFLRWAQYLCSMKYAMNLVLMTEFRLDRDNCQGEEAAKNCREIISSNNIEPKIFYVYIILLFVLFAGFRLIGAFILVQKAKRFY
eukprot:scaffold243_cov163-Ochromonas_danica.AAC.5